MNLNTSSGAGAGAIDFKVASSGAGAWSILSQLPSPGSMCSKHMLPITGEMQEPLEGQAFVYKENCRIKTKV